jgi:hypothetical protein
MRSHAGRSGRHLIFGHSDSAMGETQPAGPAFGDDDTRGALVMRAAAFRGTWAWP